MATKLILHDAFCSESGADTAYKRADRSQGSGVASSTTNTVAGPTAGVQCTDTGGGTVLKWISDPLLAGVTISGTVTFNVWGLESNKAANAGFEVQVIKYSSGAEGSTVIDSEFGTEMGTTSASVNNWTGAPSSTAFSVGDRIVIKVLINDAGGDMASGRTVTMDYNGNTAAADGDTWVQFTETLSFTRTRTVKSSGGDYTSLNAWMGTGGEPADLVTLTEIRVAELYAFQDTTAASMSTGWTTSSTYYAYVAPVAAARNTTGIYDGSNYYRLEVTGATAIRISTNPGHVWLDGLQVKLTASSGGFKAITIDAAPATGTPVYKISNCIIQGSLSGTSSNAVGIQTGTTTNAATMNLWNNIAYNFALGGRGFQLNGTNWTVNAYNCTSYNNNTAGFVGTTGVLCKNCVADSNGTDYVSSFNASSSNNAAKDGTAPGTSAQSGATTFVNAGGGNFQPAYTDTICKANGVTDPGSGLFSDDIRGVARSAPWDIGAWIVQATPAAGVPNQLMMMGCGK